MVDSDAAPSPGCVRLVADNLQAVVWPEEGAVVTDLRWRGRAVLCDTPWEVDPPSSGAPAATEDEWVERWRGGWQLCLPSTGQAAQSDALPAFHGRASQAPWGVIDQGPAWLTTEWVDPVGVFHAIRRIELGDNGDIAVTTMLRNISDAPADVQVAEHLIVGGDVLAPVLQGGQIGLGVTGQPHVIDLDYAGAPTGRDVVWDRDWSSLTTAQGGRVCVLADVASRDMTVHGGSPDRPLTVRVTWEGLAHLLVWQEFGTSREHPWNGQVMALGLEPTTTAHGLGQDAGGGVVVGAGETLEWTVCVEISERQS